MRTLNCIFFLLLFSAAAIPFAWNGSAQDDSRAVVNQKSLTTQEAILRSASGRDSGSLTTIFISNGEGAGNMFDIEPIMIIDEITALDVNIGSMMEPVLIHVYYKKGTSKGFETNPAPWTLFAIGTGVSAGLDQPTFVDISGNGVSFSAGKIYGIYVHQENYPSIKGHLRRTNGGPNTYGNAELNLTTNCSNLYPAFSSVFYPRIWNGTLYYEYSETTLSADLEEISAAQGGIAHFKLNAGPNYGGRSYLLLGSVSGTQPGIPLPGGAVLPLKWDLFTDVSIALANSPIFLNTMGNLSNTGEAQAQLDTLGPLNPSLIGLLLFFAYPAQATPTWLASNNVTIEIIP